MSEFVDKDGNDLHEGDLIVYASKHYGTAALTVARIVKLVEKEDKWGRHSRRIVVKPEGMSKRWVYDYETKKGHDEPCEFKPRLLWRFKYASLLLAPAGTDLKFG
jgi:hypothetical protein